MLKIVNFSKQYGSKIAVSNLNLLVQKGDIMGFIGKNGAGKTTTLKACMRCIKSLLLFQNASSTFSLQLQHLSQSRSM